jgi:putative heme iron utilization protein
MAKSPKSPKSARSLGKSKAPVYAKALSAARRLLREAKTCALSTAMTSAGAAPGEPDAQPYGSLALVAMGQDGAPILLISELAQHTKNLTGDHRLSLLFDGTQGLADPLTGPRLTLLGRATVSRDPKLRARFLARHPSAKRYADFKDFAFWRVEIERAHFIGGFGQIFWLTADELGAKKI